MKDYIMSEGHLEKLISIAIIVVVFAVLISITIRIFRKINQRKNSIFYKFLNSVVYVVLLASAIYSVVSQFDMAREISTVILQSGTLIIAVATLLRSRPSETCFPASCCLLPARLKSDRR